VGRNASGLTDQDELLLGFAAAHRMVLREQAQALLVLSASSAARRCSALAAAGLLAKSRPFDRGPNWFRITRAGLDSISSSLPVPDERLGQFKHDIGLAWIEIAARRGSFGPLTGVVSERRMRSDDGVWESRRSPLDLELERPPFGIRLGLGARGRQRIHYPDMLLDLAGGKTVAVELELTPKGPRRRDEILIAYAAEKRYAAVLYLVETPSMATSIRAAARELGISRKVHVQLVRYGSAASGGGGRAPSRRGTRAASERSAGVSR
jgi:hypothetical protein